MPLEILHFALVLFGCRTRFKRTQVAASTSAGVLLSRVKPILAGCKFTNHGCAPPVGDLVQFMRPNGPDLIFGTIDECDPSIKSAAQRLQA
jgi:hypothetical protein